MRKRYLYTLLFLVPGFFASVLVVGALFAVVAGTLWLFVFGDNTWPAWIETVMAVAMLTAFLCLWVGATIAGYSVGRRMESAPGINGRHVWMSLGATLLPIVIVLLHQLSIGNMGPKSDSRSCSEFCSDLGYAMSSLPPRNVDQRTCRCLGQDGDVKKLVPLEELSR